jgi:hypothetical protein
MRQGRVEEMSGSRSNDSDPALGTAGNPFRGMPDSGGLLLFADSDIESLVGRKFESRWFQIDTDAHQQFIRSSFLESTYAALSPDSVVEGFYLLSLLDPLAGGLFRHRDKHESALNYGLDRVRFISPVYPKDALRLQCEFARAESRPTGWLVTIRCTLELDGKERPAMVADWLLLFPRSVDQA